MLQTRTGKRTAQALQIACDMYQEGLISKEEALLQIEPKQLDYLLHPNFDKDILKKDKNRLEKDCPLRLVQDAAGLYLVLKMP